MSEYKPFLISYRHDGSEWNFEIMATDFDDAQARCRALAWAKVQGQTIAKIPAHSGWVAAFAVWLRNALRAI